MTGLTSAIRIGICTLALVGVWCFSATAQDPVPKAIQPAKKLPPDKEQKYEVPAKVDVKPVAHDEEIRQRLQRVLEATGWFTDPSVTVQEGIVFLSGQTQTDDLKKWAGDLARNTQDVVAVANRIDVLEPSAWDFDPAWNGLRTLWRDIIRSLPVVVFGLFILLLSVGSALLATRVARRLLHKRIRAQLLRAVIARSIGIIVLLTGVYIILRVAGLTQLALTVVGGTGLVGLAVGIAFRDITENFLASIFLSMHKPFESGDLVEITGVTGYVQQLNMRTTVLMTLNGNLMQIPNATVYKTNIRNFTTNPNRREDFLVGIGYDDAISEAQEIARKVLVEHPAVLKDPEPSVLADSMGTATINLRVYFWLNGREHSWLKVRSSVIRLVILAFQEHSISMPDEAREVVFPKGIPVTLLQDKPRDGGQGAEETVGGTPMNNRDASTRAEGGLDSEAAVIKEQAQNVSPLRHEENLLKSTTPSQKPQKCILLENL
ncbi:mechanosensitive ion channel family protein [soil metagenome]